MSVVFDRAVSYYDQTRGLPPTLERSLAESLQREGGLQAGSKALEVGIGTGRIALPLVRFNGYHYFGIDLSRPMVEVLRTKTGAVAVDVALADAARLPFASHTFDVVVAVHVFHLMSDWEGAIEEAARVIRVGGLLLSGNSDSDDDAPAETLRHQLYEIAGVRRKRQQVGFLDDVSGYLEQRFGQPRIVTTPTVETSQSAREIIDQFRNRIWSGTWDLPDEEVARTVAESERWAIERWGNLDVNLPNRSFHSWRIHTIV